MGHSEELKAKDAAELSFQEKPLKCAEEQLL